MKKSIVLSLILTIGLISCNNSGEIIDKLDIAKQYYKVLDNSNHSKIRALLTDSIVTLERDYDYKQTFSQNEYVEWLKWDAVFDPTYEILQIEQEGEMVKAKILKMDSRIFLLHEKPIVTNQVIRFDDEKIISVETTNYLIFDETTFLKNRSGFLNWIEKNHPDLNGFIHDQTEKGALKYLKAIEVYKNRK